MGSGKTVVGALVAERAHARFTDLDLVIENEVAMAISDFFATRGESAFREVESRLLPGTLLPDTVVALGGGTTIDDRNWELVRSRAVTVFLDASFSTIWQRVGGSRNRPLVASRTRDEVEALLAGRRGRYEEAAHRVDADGTPDLVAGEVLKLWSD